MKKISKTWEKKVCLWVLVMGISGLVFPIAASLENEELVKKAEGFLQLVVRGDFQLAVRDFDPVMTEKMPPHRLEQTWLSVTERSGGYQELQEAILEESGGYRIAVLTCRFARAILDVRVVFDSEQRITGLWFAPHIPPERYVQPAYAELSRFREKDVDVGSESWILPGTLSFPTRTDPPVPGVVLVHGSGPNDRDETIGPNKPFKDLAWGLASQGIAVLRYEKRTRVYRKAFLDPEKAFTVKHETVDDALAAASLLRRTSGIDPTRIFFLGHSLGGMLLPRIGMRDPQAAGFIFLAGPTRRTEDAILDQLEYIATLDGTWSPEEKKQYSEFQQAAERIRNLSAADRTGEEALMGAYPAYWLDLRDYKPAEQARRLKPPLLILQGGRDYQVTQEDFRNWKEALEGRTGVTFRFYPDLNHLFFSGKGIITPAEYQKRGNVDIQVIRDIVQWIFRNHRNGRGRTYGNSWN